jgi:hypothetical protein
MTCVLDCRRTMKWGVNKIRRWSYRNCEKCKAKCTLVQALRLCTGRTVKCTVVQALRLCTGRTVKRTVVQALRLCTGRTAKCTLVQALRLCTGCTVHRGSRGIAVHFHDLGTRGGEGSESRPGRSLPQERPGTDCTGGWGGTQGRYGQVRKILSPPGFDPRTVQPVASRYTEWATRPTEF